MPELRSRKKLLICERYPSLREAFKLGLGKDYELIFSDEPGGIMSLLRLHHVELIIWDLDRHTNSLEATMEAVEEGSHIDRPLETLRSIREAHRALKILLVAGEFSLDFQKTMIREVGLVSFVTKPWKFAELIERIQVMLGDKESSIRTRLLKVPLNPQGAS